MGVDSVGTTSHDIIKSQTVAEYFVKKVIFEVADVIKTKVDIRKLNEQCRKLAMLGMVMISVQENCSTKMIWLKLCSKGNPFPVQNV